MHWLFIVPVALWLGWQAMIEAGPVQAVSAVVTIVLAAAFIDVIDH